MGILRLLLKRGYQLGSMIHCSIVWMRVMWRVGYC